MSTAIVALVTGASDNEAHARLAELEELRRHGARDIVAIVDDKTQRASDETVIRPDDLSSWLAARPWLRAAQVIPRGAELREPLAPRPGNEDFVAYLPPPTELAALSYEERPPQNISWLCSRGVLEDLCRLSPPSSWTCASPIRAVNASRRRVAWLSAYVSNQPPRAGTADPGAPISRSRSVLAVIPTHACEEWLALAIGSIVTQTRRPDAIVVVDDASPSSPQPIVERFAGVTLLRSPSRVGPYRLVQQVIDDTHFDAYLFQDADDFSAVDRLERLLDEGELSGAHLIGAQALYFDWETGACGLATCPTTVPPPSPQSAYSVLHPSSIATRSLLQRLGGFAPGLQFGGDQELQYRAMHLTTLVNTPWCSYFKIKHPASLAANPETGRMSPARVELRSGLRRRLADNLAAVAAGAAPDLTPFRGAPPIALQRICGPSLTARW